MCKTKRRKVVPLKIFRQCKISIISIEDQTTLFFRNVQKVRAKNVRQKPFENLEQLSKSNPMTN